MTSVRSLTANLFGVKDVAAVATKLDNKDLVFQVRSDGAITHWESSALNELKATQCGERILAVDGRPIKVSSGKPWITAVAYVNPDSCKEGKGAQEVPLSM